MNVTPITPKWTDDASFPHRDTTVDHVIAEDVFHQHHTIRLCWRDRFRALFGRPVRLHAITPVRVLMTEWWENPQVYAGKCESSAHVDFILPPRLIGMGDAAPR